MFRARQLLTRPLQVKTTQPRRYLVRPNQGLIAPGGSETISIILVEKDKHVLLQSYDRLGQSALDHSKDKFLVQSTVVSLDFSKQYNATKNSKETSDALTSMWNAIASSGSANIFNKKLHVRHVVEDGAGTKTAVPPRHDTSSVIENMTPEQMSQEITTLRRKYDELVAFSVNLTAERDILNNTLEQTKRDLNKEMAARNTLENKGIVGVKKSTSLLATLMPLLIVALSAFLMGVRMTKLGQVAFLDSVPGVEMLVPGVGMLVNEEEPVAEE